MSDFTNIGNEIGGFLGGIFTPVAGQTTNTTVTEQGGGKSGNNNTIIIIAVVLVIVVIGYFVLKPKKTVS